MIEEDKKRMITDALQSKMKIIRCPMCGNHSFTILDGFRLCNYQDHTDYMELGGGLVLPAVSIVCRNCGFVSTHALGAIGLMDIGKKEQEKK